MASGLFCAVLAAVSMVSFVGPSPAAAQSKPVLYLTFDDGPGSYTPQFLDLLAAYGVQATFFLIGQNAVRDPAMVRRLEAEGHAVGNHSYTHPRLVDLSNTQIATELTRTSTAITDATGLVPSCYRPPYGATDSRVHGVAVSVGLTNEGWTAGSADTHWGLWDVDTQDWRLSVPGTWTEADVRRRLDSAVEGDVVLLHDGGLNRDRGLAVLGAWLADNHDRFDFRALPACGADVIEPSIDPLHPQAWHRFQIARLYLAYFDRAPDPEGWSYWNEVYSRGATLAQISGWFSESTEFGLLGDLSDFEFVTFVYQEVMDREPDEAGRDYWVAQLEGGITRGWLLIYFSESQEFLNRSTPVITGDCWNGDIKASYLCYAEQLPPPERW